MEFPNPLDFPAFPLADSFAARLPGSFAFCSLQSQRDGLLIMSLLRHKRVEPQCPRLSRFQRFGLLCAFAFAFAIASALLQCFNKYSFDLKAAAATFSNCGAHLFEAKSKGPTVGVRKILFCRGGGGTFTLANLHSAHGNSRDGVTGTRPLKLALSCCASIVYPQEIRYIFQSTRTKIRDILYASVET